MPAETKEAMPTRAVKNEKIYIMKEWKANGRERYEEFTALEAPIALGKVEALDLYDLCEVVGDEDCCRESLRDHDLLYNSHLMIYTSQREAYHLYTFSLASSIKMKSRETLRGVSSFSQRSEEGGLRRFPKTCAHHRMPRLKLSLPTLPPSR